MPPELAAVYRAHLDYVWHTVRRLGVSAREREDLTHDVFVAAFRAWPRFDRSRPVRPWLFGIAVRVVGNHQRSARIRREGAIESSSDTEDPQSLEAKVAARNALRIATAALLSLPLVRRAVFIMSEIDRSAGPEIAAALELPLNTVYSHLRRARREFAAATATLTTDGAERVARTCG